jgi:exosortase/archaeosortase family protein
MSKRKQKSTNSDQEAAQVVPSDHIAPGIGVRFVLGFLSLLVLFYVIYTNKFFSDHFLTPYVHFQTWLASVLLTIFGDHAVANGTELSSARTSLNVVKGCDGMEVTALYLIAILMVPFRWSSKWAGIGYGLLVLFMLNLVRILGLYLAQIYWPSGFETLHLHGGFALFTVAAIVMWVWWANWALRREKVNIA